MNISFLLIYISAHIYLLFCLVLVSVRLVWVSVAVSFSQFVEHVTCVCGCRHGLKRECVPPLPLDGEGYNTYLTRLMESRARVMCMTPFLAGGATMTASSEWLARG
jgi:hypothetical protein